MRLALMASTLVALLSVTAATQSGLSGSWKVETIGPGETLRRGWSMPTALDVKVDGNKLTGTIRAGFWPGDCPIEGTIEGDRFSFAAISQVNSSGGFPKMGFAGTVKGDTIALTMEWLAFASCQVYTTPSSPSSSNCNESTYRLPQKHEMTGERVR
jgi:hypothetical protein